MVILKAQHTSFTPTNVNINVVFNKQIVLSKKKKLGTTLEENCPSNGFVPNTS